jgi:hypothetical protein
MVVLSELRVFLLSNVDQQSRPQDFLLLSGNSHPLSHTYTLVWEDMLGSLSRQEMGDMKRPELQRLCKVSLGLPPFPFRHSTFLRRVLDLRGPSDPFGGA